MGLFSRKKKDDSKSEASPIKDDTTDEAQQKDNKENKDKSKGMDCDAEGGALSPPEVEMSPKEKKKLEKERKEREKKEEKERKEAAKKAEKLKKDQEKKDKKKKKDEKENDSEKDGNNEKANNKKVDEDRDDKESADVKFKGTRRSASTTSKGSKKGTVEDDAKDTDQGEVQPKSLRRRSNNSSQIVSPLPAPQENSHHNSDTDAIFNNDSFAKVHGSDSVRHHREPGTRRRSHSVSSHHSNATGSTINHIQRVARRSGSQNGNDRDEDKLSVSNSSLRRIKLKKANADGNHEQALADAAESESGASRSSKGRLIRIVKKRTSSESPENQLLENSTRSSQRSFRRLVSSKGTPERRQPPAPPLPPNNSFAQEVSNTSFGHPLTPRRSPPKSPRTRAAADDNDLCDRSIANISPPTPSRQATRKEPPRSPRHRYNSDNDNDEALDQSKRRHKEEGEKSLSSSLRRKKIVKRSSASGSQDIPAPSRTTKEPPPPPLTRPNGTLSDDGASRTPLRTRTSKKDGDRLDAQNTNMTDMPDDATHTMAPGFANDSSSTQDDDSPKFVMNSAAPVDAAPPAQAPNQMNAMNNILTADQGSPRGAYDITGTPSPSADRPTSGSPVHQGSGNNTDLVSNRGNNGTGDLSAPMLESPSWKQPPAALLRSVPSAPRLQEFTLPYNALTSTSDINAIGLNGPSSTPMVVNAAYDNNHKNSNSYYLLNNDASYLVPSSAARKYLRRLVAQKFLTLNNAFSGPTHPGDRSVGGTGQHGSAPQINTSLNNQQNYGKVLRIKDILLLNGNIEKELEEGRILICRPGDYHYSARMGYTAPNPSEDDIAGAQRGKAPSVTGYFYDNIQMGLSDMPISYILYLLHNNLLDYSALQNFDLERFCSEQVNRNQNGGDGKNPSDYDASAAHEGPVITVLNNQAIATPFLPRYSGGWAGDVNGDGEQAAASGGGGDATLQSILDAIRGGQGSTGNDSSQYNSMKGSPPQFEIETPLIIVTVPQGIKGYAATEREAQDLLLATSFISPPAPSLPGGRAGPAHQYQYNCIFAADKNAIIALTDQLSVIAVLTVVWAPYMFPSDEYFCYGHHTRRPKELYDPISRELVCALCSANSNHNSKNISSYVNENGLVEDYDDNENPREGEGGRGDGRYSNERRKLVLEDIVTPELQNESLLLLGNKLHEVKALRQKMISQHQRAMRHQTRNVNMVLSEFHHLYSLIEDYKNEILGNVVSHNQDSIAGLSRGIETLNGITNMLSTARGNLQRVQQQQQDTGTDQGFALQPLELANIANALRAVVPALPPPPSGPSLRGSPSRSINMVSLNLDNIVSMLQSGITGAKAIQSQGLVGGPATESYATQDGEGNMNRNNTMNENMNNPANGSLDINSGNAILDGSANRMAGSYQTPLSQMRAPGQHPHGGNNDSSTNRFSKNRVPVRQGSVARRLGLGSAQSGSQQRLDHNDQRLLHRDANANGMPPLTGRFKRMKGPVKITQANNIAHGHRHLLPHAGATLPVAMASNGTSLFNYPLHTLFASLSTRGKGPVAVEWVVQLDLGGSSDRDLWLGIGVGVGGTLSGWEQGGGIDLGHLFFMNQQPRGRGSQGNGLLSELPPRAVLLLRATRVAGPSGTNGSGISLTMHLQGGCGSGRGALSRHTFTGCEDLALYAPGDELALDECPPSTASGITLRYYASISAPGASIGHGPRWPARSTAYPQITFGFNGLANGTVEGDAGGARVVMLQVPTLVSS